MTILSSYSSGNVATTAGNTVASLTLNSASLLFHTVSIKIKSFTSVIASPVNNLDLYVDGGLVTALQTHSANNLLTEYEGQVFVFASSVIAVKVNQTVVGGFTNASISAVKVDTPVNDTPLGLNP